MTKQWDLAWKMAEHADQVVLRFGEIFHKTFIFNALWI